MFNVGGPEIIVILLVALVVLGPDQLPKAMRTFGNAMAEVRKVSGGFQAEVRKAMDTLDVTGQDKPASKVKPPARSASGPGATKVVEATASTPEEADVTEVVARNPAPAAEGSSNAAGGSEPQVEDRPAVDPADRAAG